MTLIVDASVALKWVLTEEGTDRARALVLREALAAPELLWIECANVLWVKARRGQLSPDSAKAAFAAIEATPIRAMPVAPLAASALEIAAALDHAAYDCLYLSAALTAKCALVTADEAFAAKAAAHARYAGVVHVL